MSFCTGCQSRTPRALALVGLLLLGAALAGCGPRIKVTIVNASRDSLTDLRLVGEGDSLRVADMAPGASVRARMPVQIGDAIVLRGLFGGRSLAPMMAIYVEDGYRVRLTVDSTGFVGSSVRETSGD